MPRRPERVTMSSYAPLPFVGGQSTYESVGLVEVLAMASRLGSFLERSVNGGRKAATTIRNGLADGVGGAALIVADGERRAFRRRYAGRGIAGDWGVVGSTLRQAAETRNKT